MNNNKSLTKHNIMMMIYVQGYMFNCHCITPVDAKQWGQSNAV